MRYQKTIGQEAKLSGRGLFGGEEATVVLRPASVDTGVIFIRNDTPVPVEISAVISNIAERNRRLTIKKGSVSVETIEHCLAAIYALGITNILIEISGSEMPRGLDGSCSEYFNMLKKSNVINQQAKCKEIIITESISLTSGDASISIHPSIDDSLIITYDLNYGKIAGIEKQSHECKVTEDYFEKNLTKARTFLFEEEKRQFEARGIGTHLGPRDILVISSNGPVQNSFRFPDECARHKIVDLIGALALAGRPIVGRIIAKNSGHALNRQLVERIVQITTEDKQDSAQVSFVGAASVFGDEPAEDDRLGRIGLVKALAGMLAVSNSEEIKGFTVGLLGDWGSGKSTVIELLKKELNRLYPKMFKFANFNAWEYEQTNNLAAGLAQEVVKCLTKGLMSYIGNPFLRICFIFCEYWRNLFRLILYCVVASIPLFVAYRMELPKEYLGIGMGGGAIIIAAYLFKNIKHLFEHPLAVQLETFLKLPSYGQHLGLIPILKRHIKTLCKLKLNAVIIWKHKFGKDKKLVVFIDDLDRCQPKCITETMEAIRLVMAIPNVIVFVCIDHRIAFRAIKEYYKQLDGNVNKHPSIDIARDYLGKIIHLPVRLLPPNHQELQVYINNKLFKNVIGTSKSKESESEISEKLKISSEKDIQIEEEIRADKESFSKTKVTTKEKEAIEKEMVDTTFDRDTFSKLTKSFGFWNPRQLLRLRNSYRMLKALNRMKRYKNESLIKMLFWQEYLHNYPVDVRRKFMASLLHTEAVGDIESISIKQVIENVRDDIITIFEKEDDAGKLAEFVRTVVLPHNEEDVLDSKEAVTERNKKGIMRSVHGSK